MIDGDKLPQGWSLHRLADVCLTKTGGTPSRTNPDYFQGTIPWVKSGELEDGVITNAEEAISQRAVAESNAKVFPSGTLLMAMYGATVGRLGRLALDAATNQAVCAFFPTPQLTSDFLWHYLRAIRGELLHNSFGAAQPNISQTLIRALEIPVPPLAEQRRLVARIEALTSQAQELRALNASLVEDAIRLLAADYKRICRDAVTQPFGKVAKLVRRRVETSPDESYDETGIRSFGKGTFHKPALTGRQLGNKRVFRIHPGDLVFMNVFAWEGAIAVAKPEDDGRVASHRFMMHEADLAQATAEFLCYHLLTDRGMEHIRAASPGSAGRNRTLGITKLHAIPVPVPPIEAQRRFSKLHALRDKLRRLQTETEAELAAFTPPSSPKPSAANCERRY